MGNYTNLRDVVLDAEKQGTNILSFRSTRGKLRYDHTTTTMTDGSASGNLIKKLDVPYLEAYNCDPTGLPKPSWSDRAKKQLYRTDYVLSHFVHYSTVTQKYLETYNDGKSKAKKNKKKKWKMRVHERPPSERVTDEINEAVMIHTKRSDTSNWENQCHHQYDKKWKGCYVGFPWPQSNQTMNKQTNLSATTITLQEEQYNENGMEYNCYINENVENYWLPRLKQALIMNRNN